MHVTKYKCVTIGRHFVNKRKSNKSDSSYMDRLTNDFENSSNSSIFFDILRFEVPRRHRSVGDRYRRAEPR